MTLAQQSIFSIAPANRLDPEEQGEIVQSVQDWLLGLVLPDREVATHLGDDGVALGSKLQRLQLDSTSEEEKELLRDDIFSRLSRVPNIEAILHRYADEFKVDFLGERISLERELAGFDLERLGQIDQAYEAFNHGDYALVLELL